MSTIAYVLILVGLLVIRGVTKGLGLTDIPGNLGKIITSALTNDTAGIKEALGASGSVDLAPDLTVRSGFDGTASAGSGGGGSSSGSWGDGAGSYDLGAVVPRMVPIANEVGRKFGVKRIGGYRSGMLGGQATNDHSTGRSVDFFVDSREQGNAIASYLINNASRFNVAYVIWYQRIWYPGKGYTTMADRGSDNNNHKNHVHLTIN